MLLLKYVRRVSSVFIFLVVLGTPIVEAQSTSSDPTPANAKPTANPADVESIDSIMAAVYDVISGPAGEKRDWDRFRSLFRPNAKLIPTGQRGDGSVGNRFMSIDDYINSSGPFLENNGFFEREIYRVVEQYSHIAHVFSTYESRRKAEDPEPFVRGINSFQLVNDGSRWWVINIFWEGEGPNDPIPAKYLPNE